MMLIIYQMNFVIFFTNIGQEYADKIPKSKFTHNHYMKNKVTQIFFMASTDPYEISRCIDSLKPKKSCGHDFITSILLKHIKQEISHPLSVLINKSFSTGTVPNLLKLAKVIPVYKSKDKQLLNNYRPISLLPAVSKIIEKLVHKRLYCFLSSQSVFYTSQYGFRPCHSTAHAVNEFIDDTVTEFEKNKIQIGVCLDLSKAFDTIDHNILINKLNWYGIRGIALEWFTNYLKNRKQFIQYKNIKSSTQMVPCGVPQGSILGPLLFILYINDLANSLTNSKAILFADDTTIYMSSTNIVQLYESINRDLDSLSEWFRANRLFLNISKTHYMLFGQNPVKIPETLSIKIMNEIIEHKQTVIFLGMYIDEKLDWHEYINYIKSKLCSGIYVMNKTKNYLSTKHKTMLYYSLMYPYLDYGISLWGSTHTNYIE